MDCRSRRNERDWDSKWYADKNRFADCLVEDNKVREFVKKKKLYAAGVSQGPPGKSSRRTS